MDVVALTGAPWERHVPAPFFTLSKNRERAEVEVSAGATSAILGCLA